MLETTQLVSLDKVITEAVKEPNRVLSNLKVTRAHYLLAEALQRIVGEEGGANFHTWAVWGSRKAGVTIREEGLERALREVTILSFCIGLLVGFLVGVLLWNWLAWWIVPTLSLLGAVVGSLTGRSWLISGRRRAAVLILEGNHTVLEDIGGQTARFVGWFDTTDGLDSDGFAEFLEGFRSGTTEDDGQDLLRRAFIQYRKAALTEDLREKQQAVYFANCLAILHEHIRLQPYIAGALPWIVRRCVTYRLMRYDVGPLRLAVSDDVPLLVGTTYPDALRTFDDPELIEFLSQTQGLSPSETSPTRTATSNWTNLQQRMRYILELFRVLHVHPDVHSTPYSQEQFDSIERGLVPAGQL